jgi:serine/threonine-protein kinase
MKKIGRYDIVEELGRGAMGVVYKASDPTIGRLVALKVLSLETSAEQAGPSPQEIFMREARAAGRLTHPAIVTIHDAFEEPESKSSCIVMELIPGRTLEKILLSGEALAPEKALEIAGQVAEGLEYAHKQSVIHRDLKPANILLTDEGRVKITDFGIAKIIAREGAVRTVGVMGTPSYMSPEQVSGGEVDARSDLFSLGIILYLMLTGQKPFGGDTAAVMFKIVYEDPVAPSQLNPRLGPAHDYLVLRCLAKDRNKRYANAREFLDDLDDVQQGRTPRAQAIVSPAELPIGEPTVMMREPVVALPEGAPLPAKRRPKGIAASACVGMVVLGAAIGVGFWKLRARKTALPPTSPPAATTSAPPVPAPASAGAPAEKPAEIEAAPKPRPRPATQRASAATPAAASSAVASTPVAKPAKAPAVTTPAPTRAAAGARVVQLLCKHDFKEATLTVSSGNQVIFEGKIKGKKKGGFLGIKGGYAGTFSRTITVPAEARELSVRVVTAEGSVDHSKIIPASPPAGPSATLRVEASSDRLTLNWQAAAHPAP